MTKTKTSAKVTLALFMLLATSGCIKTAEVRDKNYRASTNSPLVEKRSKTSPEKLWKYTNKVRSNYAENIANLCPSDPKCKGQKAKITEINSAIKILDPLREEKRSIKAIYYRYFINGNIPKPARVAYCLEDFEPENLKNQLSEAINHIDRAFLIHQSSALPDDLVRNLDKNVCAKNL